MIAKIQCAIKHKTLNVQTGSDPEYTPMYSYFRFDIPIQHFKEMYAEIKEIVFI